MAGVHLRSRHDVVVPQLVARIEFIEVFAGVSAEASAAFHEVLVLAPADEALGRFLARRGALEEGGVHHRQRTSSRTPKR